MIDPRPEKLILSTPPYLINSHIRCALAAFTKFLVILISCVTLLLSYAASGSICEQSFVRETFEFTEPEDFDGHVRFYLATRDEEAFTALFKSIQSEALGFRRYV